MAISLMRFGDAAHAEEFFRVVSENGRLLTCTALVDRRGEELRLEDDRGRLLSSHRFTDPADAVTLLRVVEQWRSVLIGSGMRDAS